MKSPELEIENIKLSPLASFIRWFLKQKNINFEKIIFTEKTILNKTNYTCSYFLSKEYNLEDIYNLLKKKLWKDDIIKYDNKILVKNNIDKVYILHLEKSIIEKIKEKIINIIFD